MITFNHVNLVLLLFSTSLDTWVEEISNLGQLSKEVTVTGEVTESSKDWRALYQVEAARSAWVRFYMPCHLLAVFVYVRTWYSFFVPGLIFMHQGSVCFYNLNHTMTFKWLCAKILREYNLKWCITFYCCPVIECV